MSYIGKYIFILDSKNNDEYARGHWVATPEAKDTLEEIKAVISFNNEEEAINKTGLNLAFCSHHKMYNVQDSKAYDGNIYKLRAET